MLAKILFITDMHKRWRESESIKNSIPVQQQVQEDIIEFNKANGITHNILGGDWYDRGFHGLGQAWGAIEMDRRLSKSVNGNVYLCIGNHFYLERDENPEMYIIQPNEWLKPQAPIPLPDEPIFKVVPRLQIGPVQIDFFHFNKMNKEYVASVEEGTTFHIGVYHDENCVPGYVREMEGFHGTSSQSYYNYIYRNIDLALHGHIHSKIGLVTMDVENGRKVPLYIPGSMSITQNKEVEKHTEVELPVIEIEDDGTVNISTAKFSTHMDQLRFFASKKKKDHTLVMDGYVSKEQLANMSGTMHYTSLQSFLSNKGYTPTHMKILDAAYNETLNIPELIKIISEVDVTNGQ